LFLLGNLGFKAVLWRRWPLSHLVGLGLLALAAVFATAMSPLGLAAVAMVVLVVVAAWETLSLRGAVG
jgi:low temperature requirement protein LtrA